MNGNKSPKNADARRAPTCDALARHITKPGGRVQRRPSLFGACTQDTHRLFSRWCVADTTTAPRRRRRDARVGVASRRASPLAFFCFGGLERGFPAGVVADPLTRTRIVGFAAFASGSMAFDVQRVAVHPSARRRGHATRLLASVLAAARARGAALVRLRVRDAGAEAEAAIGAYLKSGFRFETRGTEGGDGGGGGADGGRTRGRVLRDYYGPGEHAREMVAEIERRPK